MKRMMPFGVVLAMVVACGSPNTDETEVSTTENGFSRDTLRPVETEGEFSHIADGPSTAIDRTEEQYSQTAAANQGTQTAAGQSSTSGSSSTASTTEEEKKKKKMSNTTKGILIGTGAGIITGAAVSKEDRAKGAVIGGIVGAAVGGTTGAVIDKKKKEQDQD